MVAPRPPARGDRPDARRRPAPGVPGGHAPGTAPGARGRRLRSRSCSASPRSASSSSSAGPGTRRSRSRSTARPPSSSTCRRRRRCRSCSSWRSSRCSPSPAASSGATATRCSCGPRATSPGGPAARASGRPSWASSPPTALLLGAPDRGPRRAVAPPRRRLRVRLLPGAVGPAPRQHAVRLARRGDPQLARVRGGGDGDRARRRRARRVRAPRPGGRHGTGRGLDALLLVPLGTSAVTIGFGFLIALDQPPLDLRTSPVADPDRAGARRGAVRGLGDAPGAALDRPAPA